MHLANPILLTTTISRSHWNGNRQRTMAVVQLLIISLKCSTSTSQTGANWCRPKQMHANLRFLDWRSAWHISSVFVLLTKLVNQLHHHQLTVTLFVIRIVSIVDGWLRIGKFLEIFISVQEWIIGIVTHFKVYDNDWRNNYKQIWIYNTDTICTLLCHFCRFLSIIITVRCNFLDFFYVTFLCPLFFDFNKCTTFPPPFLYKTCLFFYVKKMFNSLLIGLLC